MGFDVVKYNHAHIEMCRHCSGTGIVHEVDINREWMDVLDKKCPICEGTGRIVKSSKTVTHIRAFIPKIDDTQFALKARINK